MDETENTRSVRRNPFEDPLDLEVETLVLIASIVNHDYVDVATVVKSPMSEYTRWVDRYHHNDRVVAEIESFIKMLDRIDNIGTRVHVKMTSKFSSIQLRKIFHPNQNSLLLVHPDWLVSRTAWFRNSFNGLRIEFGARRVTGEGLTLVYGKNCDTFIDVATDASIAIDLSGKAYMSCIFDDGRYHVRSKTCANSTEAEIEAISMALVMLDGARAHIYSDSLHAVQLVEKGSLRSVKRFLDYTGSTLQWVKGHSDHKLNHVADRIALISRHSENQPQDKTRSRINALIERSMGVKGRFMPHPRVLHVRAEWEDTNTKAG